MSFATRAVDSCVKGMHNGRISSHNIRTILRLDDVDVTPIEQFLESPDTIIRREAIHIIGAKGDMSKLVDVAKHETERIVLLEIVNTFADRPEGIEKIVDLLESGDDVVFEETIDMFRRAGRADCLFGLVFSRDKELVERIKRYINEHREASSS